MKLTITKPGRVEFPYYMEASGIELKYITLYHVLYNLAKPTQYTTKKGKSVSIPIGYYTYNELRNLMDGEFEIDKKTAKVGYEGVLSGGLKDLIIDDVLYLSPLCLYLYVDEINSSENLLDGKVTKLLATIPLGHIEFGSIATYRPFGDRTKLLRGKRNSLHISIKDEKGNDYTGKFTAEFSVE